MCRKHDSGRSKSYVNTVPYVQSPSSDKHISYHSASPNSINDNIPDTSGLMGENNHIGSHIFINDLTPDNSGIVNSDNHTGSQNSVIDNIILNKSSLWNAKNQVDSPISDNDNIQNNLSIGNEDNHIDSCNSVNDNIPDNSGLVNGNNHIDVSNSVNDLSPDNSCMGNKENNSDSNNSVNEETLDKSSLGDRENHSDLPNPVNDNILNVLDKSSLDVTNVLLTNSINFEYSKKGIHVACINIQHLLPKRDEIRLHLGGNNSSDIFGLVETFLTAEVSESDISIPNFSIERRDRLHKKGGGIVIYLKENVPYKRRYDLETDGIESIWVEIKPDYVKPFLLNFVYRPPSSKAAWVHLFELQLDQIDSIGLETHILGDFNLDTFLDCNEWKFHSTQWSDLVSNHGLKQLIKSPTRITKTSSTLIDHIYTNRAELISEVLVPCYSISDHFPIAFTRSTQENVLKRGHHKVIRYRCFKNFDKMLFCHDLAASDLWVIDTISEPNQSLQTFYDILNAILNKHAPVKLKRVKHETKPPWITDEVLAAIKMRDYLHKNKRFDDYKKMRNTVSHMIKEKRRQYISDAIESNKSTTILWKQLKYLAGTEKGYLKSSPIPKSLMIGDTCLTDKPSIINELNRHFVNISNLVQKTAFVPDAFKGLKSMLNDKLKYATFDINYISAYSVSKFINDLNEHKSTGLDGIGPKLLRLCVDYISLPLAKIINTCIRSGIFPNSLKHAAVIPIYKGGDKNDPNNYRPISILPTISKIFERHISKQLHEYFGKFHIIHKTQSGFRHGHSCQTALTHLIDTWLHDVDSGKYVGTVFLDLRKAFDLVDHEILLHKLELYHFSPKTVKFFASYLSNRTQLIKDNNIQSHDLPIKTGVPQGSILGPLLFLLYINDITSVSNTGHTDMYADDTTLYESSLNLQLVEHNLQERLCSVENWCKVNNMALHPAKTKCMIIASKPKLKKAVPLNLSLNDIAIENVSTHTVLGVDVDNALTWKTHINKVRKRLNSKIALLQRISYALNHDMKIKFYNAYVQPVFDYCCSIWGSGSYAQRTMVKYQKRFARIILNIPSTLNNRQSIIDDMNWLSFPRRFEYYIAVMVHKSKSNSLPEYIFDLINFAANPTYNLRSITRHELQSVKMRTSYMTSSFKYQSRKIWNSIPITLRNITNHSAFKYHLKHYLQTHNNAMTSYM